MATKAIKFSNNTTTYLPVTDASLVQMKVGNDTKSIKEVILENEEVTAAAYNELNDRLTNVETSYVKSIATSGTGTFINGVTIGNDSTGGKKLTFSYGTAASDVFITNVTAYTVDNISSGDDQILFENITFDKTRDNILAAISAEKTVVARLTIWNNNYSIHTIDLHLNEDLPAPGADIHFIGTGFINSSNYFINIVNTSDMGNEGGAIIIHDITNENISYWTNKQDKPLITNLTITGGDDETYYSGTLDKTHSEIVAAMQAGRNVYIYCPSMYGGAYALISQITGENTNAFFMVMGTELWYCHTSQSNSTNAVTIRPFPYLTGDDIDILLTNVRYDTTTSSTSYYLKQETYAGDISTIATVDLTPTAGSKNLVTSGGVRKAITDSNDVIYMKYSNGTWNTALWAGNRWVYGFGGIAFETDNIYVDISSGDVYWYDGNDLQLIKADWDHPRAAGTPTSAQSVYSVNIDSYGHSYSPITQQHDPVTVSVSQLKYDAGQTITLDDSFVNSALGSYTTTSLTGSSSNDYWKYTTSNN